MSDTLTDRLKTMDDDELFDELRSVVNQARFKGSYDRDIAKAVGEECRRRGWLHRVPNLKMQ